MEDQLLIIRKNDFLAQISQEDYHQLNVIHNFIVANKDAYIYFDAANTNKLYFVKEGYVKIGVIDDDGNELIKDILKPGDIFGQFSLDKEPASGEFAQAHKQETILCSFMVQDFRKLLENRPHLSISFSKKIGQKLRKIESRVMNLLQRDVRSRLLYFFWTLTEDIADNAGDSVVLDNFLTHDDIARLTGTTRQTVTTFIARFGEEQLVEVNRKHIVIVSKKRLQKAAKVS